MSARFHVLGVRLVVSFDANDRKNNDRRGLIGHIRTAEAHNPPLIGELNNRTHSGDQP